MNPSIIDNLLLYTFGNYRGFRNFSVTRLAQKEESAATTLA